MRFFDRFPQVGYVCAHRGARSIAPENTLLALEAARRCGAHVWETDVQMTADEQLILLHDRRLTRTTDIRSRPEYRDRVQKTPGYFVWEQLRSLDAGSWFLAGDPYATLEKGEVPADMVPRIGGQRIPLLREALDVCRDQDFPVNLEIKGPLGRKKKQRRLELLAEQVMERQCADLVLVSSFDHENLRLLEEICPALATAALVERQHPPDLVRYLKDLGAAAYHPRHDLVDAQLIRQLAVAGIRTNIWTVNDPQRFRCFAAAGATFICTDWPQRMTAAGRE